MNFWSKIQDKRKQFKERGNQREFVEFDETGFALKYDHWPIFKPSCRRMVYWDGIAKIDVAMRDCFAAHIVSLVFYDNNDQYLVHVHENVKGYAEFTKYVNERFSGFNENNFQAIEMMFPSDISFPCWDCEKTVGDLVVNRDTNSIVWKDTQEDFLKWEDEEHKNENCGIRNFFRRIIYGKSTCI